MVNHTSFVSVLFTAFLLTALVHGALHLSLYGTGVEGLYESGISGLAISSTGVGQSISNSSSWSKPLSRFVLLTEWIFVLGSFVLMAFKRKQEVRKEIASINLVAYYGNSKNKTDLDILYLLLRDKKQLKLSSISQVFHIPKETALEWGRILEAGNLAILSYPHFGEPSLFING